MQPTARRPKPAVEMQEAGDLKHVEYDSSGMPIDPSSRKALLFNPPSHVGNTFVVILLVLTLCEFCAQVVYTAVPDPRLKQLAFAAEGALNDADTVEFLWIVLFLNALCILGSIISGIMIILALYRVDRRPLFISTFLKLLMILCLLDNLTDPTDFSIVMFIIVVAILGVEVIIMCGLLLKISHTTRSNKPAMLRSTGEQIAQNQGGHSALTMQFNRLEEWNVLRQVRLKYHKQFRLSQTIFIIASVALLALSLGTFGFELKKIFMTQDPFYTTDQLTLMNGAVDHWPTRVSNQGLRVFVFILDGLRLDHVQLNPDLKAFSEDPAFVRDSKFLESYDELPSMSVPNWLTIITGSPPEMTGVLGNLMVPETKFDSMFAEAKRYGLNRGMTASPWMADLVSSTLPLLHGDGTIPTSFASKNPVYPTGDPADNVRAEIAKEGLSEKYDLFLTHFSDIDIQGHSYGVSSRYNKRNTYFLAVGNKTRLVREILAQADEDTLFIIGSDHGQVARGGHGGLGDELQHVPMWVYRKNSGLGNRNYTGPVYIHPGLQAGRVRNVDIAPTFCALLGLPVPRQTVGSFIPEAMVFFNQSQINSHWRDLYLQRRLMVGSFLLRVGRPELATADANGNYLTDAWANVTTRTDQEYIDALAGMTTVYTTARQLTYSAQVVRNVLLTALIDLVILVVLVYLVQNHTFCNLFAIFGRANLQREIDLLTKLFKSAASKKRVMVDLQVRESPGQPTSHQAGMDANPTYIESLAQRRVTILATQRRYNLFALLYALVSVVVYFALVLFFFALLYYIYGYSVWDSTMVHTPEVLPTYFVITLLPGFVAAVLIVRCYHLLYTRPLLGVNTRWFNFWRTVLWIFTGLHSRTINQALIYLTKCYMMFWTLVSLLVFFLCESDYTFIVPLVWRIHLIDAAEWGYRFRVISAMFMVMPLIIVNMGAILYWPSFKPHRSVYDKIFLVKITKRVISNPEVFLYHQELVMLDGRAAEIPDYETASDLLQFEPTRPNNKATPSPAASPATPRGAPVVSEVAPNPLIGRPPVAAARQ
ncbi:putative viral a-type inclusion protein [Paratrimastix pyriformis]|uniref:Viral a-type inclusion protein n=1 Tax=Paratrimastix pyriformis TaxID=342808 RepID=A0ABQ8U2U8_9EUKA|nr:putative viral a-type inclusion protein [Paratrimastix pyriformis]